MPEWVSDKQVFSLEEVGKSIQRTLENRYTQSFWVKAEMNKLNRYVHSGHCYPELLEKKAGKVVAELRGILWKSDFDRVQNAFMELTKEPLKDGIEILFLAQIQFDALYGLSLKILDIDPSYTLGKLELEKQASIQKLKKENLFLANKKLPFPLVPKNIALISVESSKGYSDFINIIEGNPWSYIFEYKLFPALLQGDRSVPSIIEQLRNIKKQLQDAPGIFDAVLIIRGGGGEVGLSSYNHYDLAKEIATFPIPIMTGIGHSTNETVSEMVAYRSAITPSELADFLIQHFHAFSIPLEKAMETLAQRIPALIDNENQKVLALVNRCHRSTLRMLTVEKQELSTFSWRIKHVAERSVQREIHQIDKIREGLIRALPFLIQQKKQNFKHLEDQIRLLDPKSVLKRGYSITRYQGKAISNNDQIPQGSMIETELYAGTLRSIVESNSEN